MNDFLKIRGAREHCLKNINIDLPKNKLIVISGVSGSGKSSLAFDTIYAEGQRRYVESLSAYARQFLEIMPKPDVDSIDGLSPAISIEQKTSSNNPRSTVGTITEIYDYLRLLFARVGVPHSPTTGLPIESQTVSQMVDRIMVLEEGTRIFILAPIIRGRKGEHKKDILELKRKGFQRVMLNGIVHDIDDIPEMKKNVKHHLDLVVDRLVLKPDLEQRLAATLETALKLGEDIVFVQNADTAERMTFSAKYACPDSGFTLEEVEPRLFSFNSPSGACKTCDGLGVKIVFSPELIIPDESLCVLDEVFAPWKYLNETAAAVLNGLDINPKTAFKDLPEHVKNLLLLGSNGDPVEMIFQGESKRAGFKTSRKYEGILPTLQRIWAETDSDYVRESLTKYQREEPCHSCGGYRLRPEALCVKIKDFHIGKVTDMSIEDASEWFHSLEDDLSPQRREIGARIIKEIRERLKFLVDVGLGYLSLSRKAGTLSGGESQRIRLASQIGSGLSGVLYVLDEPSIGLHQRDNDRLLVTLKRLRDLGNTVIVVEHDEDTMKIADYLVDIGPAAGKGGGYVIAEGDLKTFLASPESITAQYLRGDKKIELPEKRRDINLDKVIGIRGARSNNLKNVSVDIPLGVFTCVTGVSGSGKSSLVLETLYKAIARHFRSQHDIPGAYDEITGLDLIDKVIEIDQSPIGRTPRSNPATYVGFFSNIRTWYSELPEAKARGYSPGRFSFNVRGGRCESCQGDGVTKIEMHFLPDVYVQCEECKGRRYNRETLEVLYREKSIADILDMTVEEGVEFFENVPVILNKLKVLKEVGLGYIQIGQRATTLSGGEAQRIKLAKELSRRSTGQTLYILDEPTTGLHFEDVRKLLKVLHALTDQGNTIVVIEHNLDVIKTSDYIIDIGPEGGKSGGQVIAKGTPEQVAKVAKSYTGKYLKNYLS